MEKFTAFARIAEIEFSDIILSTQDLGHKLRIYLKDKTFIDFFYTIKLENQKFSLHWERTHIDNSIFRLDNTPDRKLSEVSTFPTHFHNKTYNKVYPAPFTIDKKDSLKIIFRKFMKFVKNHLEKRTQAL